MDMFGQQMNDMKLLSYSIWFKGKEYDGITFKEIGPSCQIIKDKFTFNINEDMLDFINNINSISKIFSGTMLF